MKELLFLPEKRKRKSIIKAASPSPSEGGVYEESDSLEKVLLVDGIYSLIEEYKREL
jgi:hypothetical protein